MSDESFNSASFSMELEHKKEHFKEIREFKEDHSKEIYSENHILIENLTNLDKEFDNILKKLREKDTKLKWEVERLDEKERKLIEKLNKPQIICDYFSFSLNLEENQTMKDLSTTEKRKENQRKISALEEKEIKVKSESSKILIKEKEIEAKFQHMNQVYEDFVKIKREFLPKNSKLNENYNEKCSSKERELHKTEKILNEKENNFSQKNSQLSLIIQKLNDLYSETQNIGDNEGNNSTLPSIHTFKVKKANFMT